MNKYDSAGDEHKYSCILKHLSNKGWRNAWWQAGLRFHGFGYKVIKLYGT